MAKAASLLLIICLSWAAVSGPVLGADVKCGNHVSKEDLDLSKFAGTWYHVYGNVDEFKEGSLCVREQYVLKDDGKSFDVRNSGILANGTFMEMCGSANVKDASDTGRLTVRPSSIVQDWSYQVLETDYTKWAAIYGCTVKSGKKVENYWVLTRVPTTTNELLEDALLPFVRNDIEISSFYTIPHLEDCVYAAGQTCAAAAAASGAPST